MHIFYLSFAGGGLDTNVRVLAPALAKSGHRISVLYIEPPGAIPAPSSSNGGNGYKIFHATSGVWHYNLARATLGLTRLPRLVRAVEEARALQKAIGEIHQQCPIDLIELPEIYVTPRSVNHMPFVVRLHSSDWVWNQMLGTRPDAVDSFKVWIESRSLHYARSVSSPSLMLADHVRKACGVKQLITIIPYPVDTDEFSPGNVRSKPPVVLFVGRVEKRKGADVLMRAASSVWAEHPDCEFVFAGRVCEDVKDLVAKMPARARFLGMLAREKLVTWYQQAAIFVAPSLWDNSPNTIYEAMSCGTPVIASKVGGIPELIEHGSTGLLVPPNDPAALGESIVSLLKDEPTCLKMGRGAREKVLSEYSVEMIAQQTLNFYEGALTRTK